MITKICSKCLRELSCNLFSKKGKSIQVVCKECQKKYAKQHYQNNKKYYITKAVKSKTLIRAHFYEIINKLKNVPCADCNNTYDPCVMDFDHIHPEHKLFTISKRSHNNLEKTLQEIKKCEVVCANCHRLRTKNRKICSTNTQ